MQYKRPPLLRQPFQTGLFSNFLNDGLFPVLAQADEPHAAGLEGEEGVVAAFAHIDAGVDVGAALTDQNVARQDELPVGALHAQPLGLAVAAIAGGANAFLVGKKLQTNVQHGITPPCL